MCAVWRGVFVLSCCALSGRVCGVSGRVLVWMGVCAPRAPSRRQDHASQPPRRTCANEKSLDSTAARPSRPLMPTPMCAARIMPTSLAPSPMPSVIAPASFLTRLVTWRRRGVLLVTGSVTRSVTVLSQHLSGDDHGRLWAALADIVLALGRAFTVVPNPARRQPFSWAAPGPETTRPPPPAPSAWATPCSTPPRGTRCTCP